MAGQGQRRLQGGGRKTHRRARLVVVVESPAKAKTIGAWLGPSCRVMATRGHVSDLPSKAGSVKPEDGFAMRYETGRRAARTLGAIARALAGADGLVLATDPDREGEAIAWQVLDWLEQRDAIGGRRVERATFHEVTEEAVRAALDNPRAIDMDLVQAWQGAAGAGLPGRLRPVAGAVAQAAGLPLGGPGAVGGAAPDLRARGRMIEAFVPRQYWTVEAEAEGKDGGSFAATLVRLDGTDVGEFGPRVRAERAGGGGAHPGGAVPGGRGSSATPCTGRPTRRSRPRPCSWRRSAGSASGSARPWRSPSGSTRASTSAPRPPG